MASEMLDPYQACWQAMEEPDAAAAEEEVAEEKVAEEEEDAAAAAKEEADAFETGGAIWEIWKAIKVVKDEFHAEIARIKLREAAWREPLWKSTQAAEARSKSIAWEPAPKAWKGTIQSRIEKAAKREA